MAAQSFGETSRWQANQLPRWCDIPVAWASKSTPFFVQLLDQAAGARDGVSGIDAIRVIRSSCRRGGIAENFLNRSADPMRSIAPLRNAAPQPELLDPPAAVELIIAVGHHQVRNRRLDALGQRPDTAVVNR